MRNLESRFYVDPVIFERERTELFARTWQLLGPASGLQQPGSYVAAEIAGMKVIAVRGRDGELRGFKNVCRHRGARLLPEGTGHCSTIRCPYHQWVFDDKGTLLAAPWFGEDADFRKEDWPLEPIHLASWRGLLFASIDPQEGLKDQLGELVDELADEPVETYHATGSERVNFDSNWKVYTDNFVEGYHIPGVHPGFFAAISFEEFKTTAHKGYVRMTAPPRDGLFYRGKWLWMWPNWTLSLFDGGMNTSRINPIARSKFIISTSQMFPKRMLQRVRISSRAIWRSSAKITKFVSIPTRTTRLAPTRPVRSRPAMSRALPTFSPGSKRY